MDQPTQLEFDFDAPAPTEVQVALVYKLDTFRQVRLRQQEVEERTRLLKAILESAPSLPPEAEAM